VRYQGGSATTLTFAPSTPVAFDAGGHTPELNDAFREQMRFSPEYPPRKGRWGFVILLHDPHQSVSGRYQTLAGLRALISTNADTKFRFLVEGAHENPSRALPFNGLDRIVNAAGETRAAVVYSLLGRYAINTPLAYRLLYDQKISAYAIDNNELLRYDAPPTARSLPDPLRPAATPSQPSADYVSHDIGGIRPLCTCCRAEWISRSGLRMRSSSARYTTGAAVRAGPRK
jgi:hypothetical protein